MRTYEKLMKKCLSLAKKGIGKTSPNPMVGCIVLDSIGNIISTGYHHKYGENHAERDALMKLHHGEENGGTLIVNLEPCSHYGKTPPCTDLIIERKIKKVVIGCIDKNPKVAGKGIKKLKDAGIEVVVGVLESECRSLNEIFFTNVEKNKAFVALKTATTIDGKIATKTGDSKWITSERSRKYARKLRTYYDAILTSSSTIIADNPTMKHSTKIIIDRELKTSFNSKIYQEGKIILVSKKQTTNLPQNVKIIKYTDLTSLLKELYNLGIKSIFIEAGGILSGEFIKQNLVDKIYHFIAPKIANDNDAKSCFDGNKLLKISDSNIFKLSETKRFDDDLLIVYTI